MYKRKKGYADPTAGTAMSQIMKEYRQEQKQRYADKNRRKVYVASMYAGDADANVVAAITYCRCVVDEGYMLIASHCMYYAILNYRDKNERESGLMFGLALLHLCDEVRGFEPMSSGMAREIEKTTCLHILIRYFEEVGV